MRTVVSPTQEFIVRTCPGSSLARVRGVAHCSGGGRAANAALRQSGCELEQSADHKDTEAEIVLRLRPVERHSLAGPLLQRRTIRRHRPLQTPVPLLLQRRLPLRWKTSFREKEGKSQHYKTLCLQRCDEARRLALVAAEADAQRYQLSQQPELQQQDQNLEHELD